MAQKCVHKGCGKNFTDTNEDCLYHAGVPVFHEGQKGWKCCKPRVLTFEEFLSIPPCTIGKHSTDDDPAAPEDTKSTVEQIAPVQAVKSTSTAEDTLKPTSITRMPQTAEAPTPSSSPPSESESDDPSVAIPQNASCRRRGCISSSQTNSSQNDQECIYHPGHPVFHEGSKGWTCCKRRVLEFDEFMRIGGCKQKPKHLFVGSSKNRKKEESFQDVRYDFYQTQATVIASFYLKKINKEMAQVIFGSPLSIILDLPTLDLKRYKTDVPLFGPIDTEKSSFKIMGTKLELTLVKTDYSSWPTLRSDEKRTSEIIQVGRPGRV